MSSPRPPLELSKNHSMSPGREPFMVPMELGAVWQCTFILWQSCRRAHSFKGRVVGEQIHGANPTAAPAELNTLELKPCLSVCLGQGVMPALWYFSSASYDNCKIPINM